MSRLQSSPKQTQCSRTCTHKTRPNVRFSPKATELPRGSEMTRCAKIGREQSQQGNRLFDHLIGAGEQRGWNSDAKLFRSRSNAVFSRRSLEPKPSLQVIDDEGARTDATRAARRPRSATGELEAQNIG